MKTLTMDGRAVRRFMPHGPPFTLIDGIERYEPDKRLLVAKKMVSQNEPFLQGHFPDFPILPGVIIVESLAQAAGLLMNFDFAMSSGIVLDPSFSTLPPTGAAFLAESRVKFIAAVYPGDCMSLEAEVTQVRGDLYVCRVRALVEGREVAKGQVTMARTLGSALGGAL